MMGHLAGGKSREMQLLSVRRGDRQWEMRWRLTDKGVRSKRVRAIRPKGIRRRDRVMAGQRSSWPGSMGGWGWKEGAVSGTGLWRSQVEGVEILLVWVAPWGEC